MTNSKKKPSLTTDEWLDAVVAEAPPLTEEQIRLLRQAFSVVVNPSTRMKIGSAPERHAAQ